MAINAAAAAKIEWTYPLATPPKTPREPRGLEFLKHRAGIMKKWQQFWPQTGTPPTWDGVARLRPVPGADEEWLLIEAKANHPEFCGSPCGASVRGGRGQIEKALGHTKEYLGVHRHFSWLGSYYQHANRLACLYFLNVGVGVAARVIELFFIGDRFPNGTPCPANESRWRELILARNLTLGLGAHHPLSDKVHEVFLPVLQPATSGANA